jgi:hypothetical protein
MNRIVHSAKEDASRGFTYIGEPAIQQNRNVMIPMQEDKRLFVDYNEERV